MGDFDINEFQGKFVVLIGELTQEGVTTKIKTLGHAYKQKRLISSKPQNWIATKELITELRLSNKIVAIFVHLTEGLLLRCNKQDYKKVWKELVNEILQNNSIFFIYKNNLEGIFSTDSWKRISNSEIKYSKETINELYSQNATVLSYSTRIDLTVEIQEYLDNLENGVILRLYVPNKRYQAEQLASLLKLLENYLQNIERISFSIDLQKTAQGHVYTFKSINGIKAQNINDAIQRFENFMELCMNDHNRAILLLNDGTRTSSEIQFIVPKYIRDYSRLKMDIRHEFEQKKLILLHALENEVNEEQSERTLRFFNPPNGLPGLLFVPQNLGTINLTINQQIFGDVTYNDEDKQLLELFNKHAENIEAVILKSHLDELKDSSTPSEKKITAKQKIKSFLYKIMSITGESIVKGLLAYLEKKLTTGI